ncbi:MAG: type II toxin-antitoxin system RelE/ParE family toxin [Balneolaceae bacterium]|nr:type II toxin-antitoxin system RelE/ParE family toxin [Balneolaceae bacterium]
MKIDFHPAAQNEFLTSIKYYNKKAAGLGDQFYTEVQTALALLRSFPEIGTPFEGSFRKFSLNRFSFALIYKYDEENNYLEIYAVMHQSRKPNYWTSRK